MGNTISSIKSVIVTSMKKGVFSRYVEFWEKCSKYQFECKSFPVVETIVNNGIIFPCQVLVMTPIIIYGAVTNYPVTVASHCFTVFKLGAPFLSTQYIYTMALIQFGYNIPYFLDETWKYVCRQAKKLMDPQDPVNLPLDRVDMWCQFQKQQRIEEYYRKQNERMEILNPPIRYEPPPVVRPHPAPWEIRTWG